MSRRFQNHVTQNKLLAFQSRRLSCGTEDDYRRRRISCVQSCTSHHKEFCGTQHKPVAGPCAYYGRHFGLSALYLALYRLIKQRWVSSALLITVAMIASLCLAEVFAAGEVAFIMAIGAILEDKTAERAKRGSTTSLNLRRRRGALSLRAAKR